MKKIGTLIFIFSFFQIGSFGQIPFINQLDMPNIGDTIRLNELSYTTQFDCHQAGENQFWNYVTFTPTSQKVDTFKRISATSMIYSFYFNDATIAATQGDLIPLDNGIIDISLTNGYGFYKETTTTFSQLGFGALFNGFPLPVRYNKPDVMLRFPLTMGAKDSCDFSYNVSIPNLGYYGQTKHRVNHVDAWGTIITPVDTFIAVRVVSYITSHDSIYLDTLGIGGFSFNQSQIEYKWYADNIGLPAMKMTITPGITGGTQIEYSNLRRKTVGIDETNPVMLFAGLYPNPATEFTHVYFSLDKATEVEITMIDMLGREIKTAGKKKYACGYNTITLNLQELNITKGLYFVKVSSVNNSKTFKLQVI